MAERVCDGCGRPIASAAARVCPACGFPTREEPAAAAGGVLRKPKQEPEPQPQRPPAGAPAAPARVAAPPPAEVRGPYCPACNHRGPPHRIRCERCGAELWPGAAAPRMPGPPPRPGAPAPGPPERPWLTPLLFVAAAVAAIALVYGLTYALA